MRPLPSTLRAAADERAPAPRSPISSSSLSRDRASGRSCRKPNSRRLAGGAERFTANSISTGAPMPQAPDAPAALAGSRPAGSVPCLSTGAKRDQAHAGAREAVVDGVVLRRLGGAPRRPACRRLRPRRGRSDAPRSRGRRRPRASPASSAQNVALRVLAATSATDENWTRCCGIARAEAQAGAAVHDRAAQAQGHGGDAVLARPAAATGRSCASAPRPRSRDRSARRAPLPRPAGG